MNQRSFYSALSISALMVILLACFLGSTPISPQRLLAAMVKAGPVGDQLVFWEIRLPRALAAFLVGACLGASGAALQALLRNPLAEPGVLGVSACSALAATLALFYGAAIITPIALPIAAILGALFATGLLAFIAMRISSILTLILIGVALSSFAGALMALLLNLAPNPFTLSDLITWTLGSVANRSVDDLLFVLPYVLLGAGCLFVTRRALTALSLGEETAFALGVDLQRTRLLVILGAGLLTGAAVATAGAVGFVGVIAPHIVRPFVNYDPARTILPSALLGGILLVGADIGVRLIPAPTELRLGVVAALIGAPVFAWIAAQRRVTHD